VIVKHLILGKQLYLASSMIGIDENTEEVIELRLPIDIFWQAEALLKKADYLIAAGDHPVDILQIYKKIFKKVAPYAALEKDRLKLYEKAS
jgi:hypothetical protein